MLTQKRLYVYILSCSDGSYYIGVTNNPQIRLQQHNNGINKAAYTYSRRPVKLLYWEEYTDFKQAIAREKQLKGWTRDKKEALMAGNCALLHELAACKNSTSHLNFSFGKDYQPPGNG
ncbi:MAG TPA: GIY-YIG nuclease family protein [Chitinophagales bacterium]|nr:GIY-YIG nuclease family protein [Chitinophagales bacterium]